MDVFLGLVQLLIIVLIQGFKNITYENLRFGFINHILDFVKTVCQIANYLSDNLT
jgi:hypothetical protein